MLNLLLATALLAQPAAPPAPPKATIDTAVLEQVTVMCKTQRKPAEGRVVFACAIIGPDGTVLAADGLEGPTDAMGRVDAGVPLGVWMQAIAKMLEPLAVVEQQAGLQ